MPVFDTLTEDDYDTLTENRFFCILKKTLNEGHAYDFETLEIKGGKMVIRNTCGEIITHNLEEIDHFAITIRNSIINSCI